MFQCVQNAFASGGKKRLDDVRDLFCFCLRRPSYLRVHLQMVRRKSKLKDYKRL